MSLIFSLATYIKQIEKKIHLTFSSMSLIPDLHENKKKIILKKEVCSMCKKN